MLQTELYHATVTSFFQKKFKNNEEFNLIINYQVINDIDGCTKPLPQPYKQ